MYIFIAKIHGKVYNDSIGEKLMLPIITEDISAKFLDKFNPNQFEIVGISLIEGVNKPRKKEKKEC